MDEPVTGQVRADFWNGKRVLITGHTGFKGSWLTFWLVLMGADVVGASLDLPTHPALFPMLILGEEIEDHRLDIRNLEAIGALVEHAEPDVVLHLAAQPMVRLSYDEPASTYATNVMGTVNLLEGVRRSPRTEVTVVITSDKCYENREWEWGYREEDPLGGADPYSSSKGCAELVAGAYRRSFFSRGSQRLATARAGNVIGGGDWGLDRLVPDLMRAASSGTTMRLRRPEAVRPWQHVLDCLGGYLLLAQALSEEPSAARAWNFGPSPADQLSVRQVVELVKAEWPDRLPVEIDSTSVLHEAGLLTLDSSRSRNGLGWRPRWDAEQAVKAVVQWHLALREGRDVRTTSEEQIRRHSMTDWDHTL